MWFLLSCRPEPGALPPSSQPPPVVWTEAQLPRPAIAAVEPSLGDPLGGVVLTITGAGLALGSVQIGGAPCVDVAPPSASSRTCRSPALSPGVHELAVLAPTGVATIAWEAWSPAQIPGARVYSTAAGLEAASDLATTRVWPTTAGTSPWHPRDGAGLLWFDDALWLLGGWYPPYATEWDGLITTNEVWSSPDLGLTWVLELPHVTAPPTTGPDARWVRRHTAGWLVHEVDGVAWMYVVGGDIFQVVGDVWRSADGRTWELVAAHTPWEGRVLQMVGSYDGALYVMGGQTLLYEPQSATSDVWRSGDGGATWVRLPDAPWAPRGMVYNPFEHDGRLWLIGGGTYDDQPRSYYSDVWSYDGDEWTEVLADGLAPWDGREYHNTFAAEGELWVSSGYSPAGNHGDVWHSADGVTWTELGAASMAPGHADGVAVTPFGAIHASGNAMDTAVHRMQEVSAAPVARWADLGPDGVDLWATDDPPLVVASAFGDRDGVVFDGQGSRLALSAWENHPNGRSVFWVGKTLRAASWAGAVNAPMTVVGDSRGSCRAQAGYADDQLALVVTDALGDWSAGQVRVGAGLTDGAPHLVGFTHDAAGQVVGWVDGVPQAPVATSYDGPWMGWDQLGAGFAGGEPAEVALGLVLVVPGVVSEGDIARLTAFARPWGAR